MRAATTVGLILCAVGCVSGDRVDEAEEGAELAIAATGAISVPWQLDFGSASCDAYPWSQSLTITSSFDEPVSYDVDLDFRSTFEVWPTSGTIPAHGRADLRVTPKRPIGADAIPPGDYRETLTVRTSRPASSWHHVQLRRTVLGAVVAVEPRSIAFGAVAEGEVAERELLLVNDGNETATVSLSTAAPFGVERRSVMLLPRARERVGVTFTGGVPGTTASGSVSIRATRACNDVPGWVSLSGRTEP